MTEQQKTVPEWFPLAAATLTAAARQDYAEATRLGQQLADQVGPSQIPRVMCAWIDTVAARTGIAPQQFDGMVWVDKAGGEPQFADDVPPAVRWAGRLFLARVNLDQDTFLALIDSVQSDEEWQRNVSTLLMQCGAQLRRAGRRDVSRG